MRKRKRERERKRNKKRERVREKEGIDCTPLNREIQDHRRE